MFISATLGKPILRWTDKIRIRLAEINFRFNNRKAKYSYSKRNPPIIKYGYDLYLL
jgi:hypothetical protein